MGKKLGAVLVSLGMLLLTLGLLSKFYAYQRLAVAPANQNSVTLAFAKDATFFRLADQTEQTGDLLTTVNTVGDVNSSKQISEKLGKPVVVWEQMSYSDTPEFNKSSGDAPMSATHSRIAFDANTAEAIQCCGTFVTDGADLDTGTEKRNADVKFEGLLVKFPFNTQKKTYRLWDTTLQKAMPASYKGTEKTQLFNIDGGAGWLVLQDPPNDGKLNPVGEIGVKPAEAGFDIASDGKGGNEAWLVVEGGFHSVNLETGATAEVGRIDGANVRDIAILPVK